MLCMACQSLEVHNGWYVEGSYNHGDRQCTHHKSYTELAAAARSGCKLCAALRLKHIQKKPNFEAEADLLDNNTIIAELLYSNRNTGVPREGTKGAALICFAQKAVKGNCVLFNTRMGIFTDAGRRFVGSSFYVKH